MTGNHALSSKSVHDESFVRPSFSIQSGQHAHQEQKRENSKSRDDQIFNWNAEHIASYHNPEIRNHGEHEGSRRKSVETSCTFVPLVVISSTICESITRLPFL